jgi:glycosyltransferase involved in cell wall biosynthesis
MIKWIFFYQWTNRFYSEEIQSWHRQLIKGSEHIFGMVSLLKKIKQLDPDVIHFQWLPLPILDRLFINRLKDFAAVVHTVHDTEPYHGATPSRLQVMGIRSVPKVFDELIVHTEDGKNTLIDRGIQDSKISVIPHGPIEYPDTDIELNDSASQSGDKKTVLFFGGIKEYKGVDVLLRAFANLPSELHNQTKLKIAGSSSLEIKELQEMASDLGIEQCIDWDIRYIPDEEVPRLFNSAEVVVFPYRNADQSGALMTTLPYGKPIIASNVGGFSEVLDDGIHGHLVEPERPESLSAALEDVLSNESKRTQMGEEVLSLYENAYSWENIANQTVNVYGDAINST